MTFAERMLGGGGAYDGLGSGLGLARAHKKSRPLTISDQGATLRVTTLIRTGFDANASTVPILIPGMRVRPFQWREPLKSCLELIFPD